MNKTINNKTIKSRFSAFQCEFCWCNLRPFYSGNKGHYIYKCHFHVVSEKSDFFFNAFYSESSFSKLFIQNFLNRLITKMCFANIYCASIYNILSNNKARYYLLIPKRSECYCSEDLLIVTLVKVHNFIEVFINIFISTLKVKGYLNHAEYYFIVGKWKLLLSVPRVSKCLRPKIHLRFY